MANTQGILQGLVNVLSDEKIMLVVSGSILGYVFFMLAASIGYCLYPIGFEGSGLLMFIIIPAICSVLPSFIFVLKRFEMGKSAAITLYFAGLTPWIMLNAIFSRPSGLVVVVTIFSLWASMPLLALALKDLKNKRPEGPFAFFLAMLVLFYFVFVNPIADMPSLLSSGWRSLLIPFAEYSIKITVFAIPLLVRSLTSLILTTSNNSS